DDVGEPQDELARLSNIIKRRSPGGEGQAVGHDTVTFGPFSYRIDRGELRRADETIRITEREREILTILAQAGGGNVEREALAGGGGLAAERSIDVQINRLRRKTEVDPANPLFLQTVRGVGYRLAVD
ncbi:winged helix-turn-helix domain-containing protein, partial [Methylobacterium goesingense]|uniref:winged helix-turn-helix domain-containing protein n=1 Tax=Methylobacterium goesingense TaxID=243690 RepID=UPI001EE20EB9